MKSIKYTAAAIAIAAMGLASCGKDDPTITYNDIEKTISGKSELIEEVVNKDVTIKLLPSQNLDIAYNDEIQLAEISDPELSGVTFASLDQSVLAVDKSGKAKLIGYNPEYPQITVVASYNGRAIGQYLFSPKGKGEATTGEGNTAKTISCNLCKYYVNSNISKAALPDHKHYARLEFQTENGESSLDISFAEDENEFVWDSKKAIFQSCYYNQNYYGNNPKLEFSVENNIIKLTLTAENYNEEKISIKYEGPLADGKAFYIR